MPVISCPRWALMNIEGCKSFPCGDRILWTPVDTYLLRWEVVKRRGQATTGSPYVSFTLKVLCGDEHWRDITDKVALSDSPSSLIFLCMAKIFKGRTQTDYSPCFYDIQNTVIWYDSFDLRWPKQLLLKRGKRLLEDCVSKSIEVWQIAIYGLQDSIPFFLLISLGHLSIIICFTESSHVIIFDRNDVLALINLCTASM